MDRDATKQDGMALNGLLIHWSRVRISPGLPKFESQVDDKKCQDRAPTTVLPTNCRPTLRHGVARNAAGRQQPGRSAPVRAACTVHAATPRNGFSGDTMAVIRSSATSVRSSFSGCTGTPASRRSSPLRAFEAQAPGKATVPAELAVTPARAAQPDQCCGHGSSERHQNSNQPLARPLSLRRRMVPKRYRYLRRDSNSQPSDPKDAGRFSSR